MRISQRNRQSQTGSPAARRLLVMVAAIKTAEHAFPQRRIQPHPVIAHADPGRLIVGAGRYGNGAARACVTSAVMDQVGDRLMQLGIAAYYPYRLRTAFRTTVHPA